LFNFQGSPLLNAALFIISNLPLFVKYFLKLFFVFSSTAFFSQRRRIFILPNLSLFVKCFF